METPRALRLAAGEALSFLVVLRFLKTFWKKPFFFVFEACGLFVKDMSAESWSTRGREGTFKISYDIILELTCFCL